MPDIIADALAIEGIGWLIVAVLAAGLVRGFSGFGSGMIIMPAAATVLSPVEAILFLVITDIVGPLPNLPSALREGTPADVMVLLLPVAVTLPLGLWCLTLIDPVAFGWFISGAVLVLLALVMTGWRYRGLLTRSLTVAAGGLGGFMTGFAGMPGPPVIMLYMASTLPVSVIRANFLLYLLGLDLILLPILYLTGLMVWPVVVLGLLIAGPYALANLLGAKLFNPEAARMFRYVAYTVIAASAILGLPLWKG
ncbi:MAG: sulfite exporter TauE/SafE family protein [Sulfitobacter sp.]|nr:sulfite exporter TauE/SafE family protein [Sulfitobacter sp.]